MLKLPKTGKKSTKYDEYKSVPKPIYTVNMLLGYIIKIYKERGQSSRK